MRVTTTFRRLHVWLVSGPLLVASLFAAQLTHASLFPRTYHVGPTGPGSACDTSSIQEAIGAAAPGDTIIIDGALTYSSQHLTIDNTSLTLQGGPCQGIIGGGAAAVDAQVTLSGDGNASSSVLNVSGAASVTLIDLKITGNATSGSGGGITFDGSGTLSLTNVSVSGNSAANHGGGIEFIGEGGALTLAADANSKVNNNAAGGGGGIAFTGVGTLSVDGVSVGSNTVQDSGGGIEFIARGGDASLVIGANSQFIDNTANGGDSGGDDGLRVGGGGIYIEYASLVMVADGILVFGNHAPKGYGGGIAVVGPAVATIGSPGGFTQVINLNDAAYGGGLAVLGGIGDAQSAQVQIFTTDSSRPVGITNNTASHAGGGVFVKPYRRTIPYASSGAYFCAWDFQIESNIAVEGAAIYADTDSNFYGTLGGSVEMGICRGTVQRPVGAVPCRHSTSCSTIDGNTATDPEGGVILMQTGGTLNATRFSMRNNVAPHVIRIIGDYSRTVFADCVIADNRSAYELIHVAGNNTPLTIESCTLANDKIDASHVIHAESDLTLTNDIIHETGTLALDYSGNPAKLSINYVLSNDITTLPGSAGTGIVYGSPDFVDAVNGDHHLTPTSPGVDFAPPIADAFDGADLDGNPRIIDLPSVSNAFGGQDLGAYELQCGGPGLIFCDGFDH